ncbi:MAG: VCBS repeat-containing protein [Myxococcales bacterium]|nr:VCBS repeat-containing protein [Myxococcales bacterium]
MRLAWLLLPAALAACRGEEAPPPTAAPPTAAPPPLVVEPPVAWSRDIRASEAAVSELERDALRPLCNALKTEDPPALRATLAPDFQGRLWAAAVPTLDDAAVRTARLPAADATLDRAAFAEAALAERARFAVVDRCGLRTFRFLLAEPRLDEAWARLAFEVVGKDAEGHPRSLRAEWVAQVARTPDGWRLKAAAADPGEAVTVLAAPFADVTAAVGLGLHRDAASTEAITAQVDGQRLETVGGLGVVDANGDGFPDLLAWNRRRTLQLFMNDGRGGFLKKDGLLPATAVGYQQLWLDLDGDGVDELVSSELLGCAHDRGEFGVYRLQGDALQRVGTLPFKLSCVDPGRAIYQHISAADVDGDGRVDLLLAGFGNHLSRRANFNHFDGRNGERNLLFMNQGGLKFSEEGLDRGLTGTRFSYVTAFFDLDSDGDQDLYVANDFGPNELFTNDGQGRFQRVLTGPMVENGQSMGLTVADFDGDLDLDLYVSNMYSKAGKRIVPLAQGRLSPETFKTLEGLAAGNTLYLREGDGYVEKATDLHVAKAGWAWGQALFDADNDGDRDLYVVNGMTSHSKDKENDF